MSDVSVRPSPRVRAGSLATLAVVVVLAVVASFLALASSANPAGAQAAEEEAFFRALNETRTELGLPELTINTELTSLSRVWAAEMAEEGEIFHANPISENMTSDWLKLGENVGVGPEVDALMDAFIASPTHYQNIIDPEFTHVGVGVVWEGDLMFTTHRFMKLADRTLSTPTTSVAGQSDLALEDLPINTRPTSSPGGELVAPPASEARIAVLVDAFAKQHEPS